MREAGVQLAIDAAGGIGALARAIGISQPAVSSWKRVPADRLSGVSAATGLPRMALRPDLFGGVTEPAAQSIDSRDDVDEVDLARAGEYALLATLLACAPTAEMLDRLIQIKGDATPLGLTHIALAEAAADADPDALQREFFDLFIGVGRGELLPYGSYYLTGFLNERPLARVRADLAELGIEVEDQRQPEDHLAILFDVMAGLAGGRFESEAGADRCFFERHVKPWAARFFADLGTAKAARFYRAVAAVGQVFLEVEARAFEMDG